jgi:hypothetical protein
MNNRKAQQTELFGKPLILKGLLNPPNATERS